MDQPSFTQSKTEKGDLFTSDTVLGRGLDRLATMCNALNHGLRRSHHVVLLRYFVGIIESSVAMSTFNRATLA